MPRERVFWMVLASLILAGLAASFFGDRPRTVQLVLSPEAPPPQPQAAAGRSWREARFERIASIPAGDGVALKNPTLLRVDSKGDLYVLDSGESQVEKYSGNGRLLAVYGAADLGNPTDVAVSDGGEVWVVDPDRRRITVFSPQGKVARRIGLDQVPFRLALDGRGGFVATFHKAGEDLFRSYSASGEPGRSFGRFFPEDLQSTLTADGWIVTAGSGSFLYPFRHAGLLASYTMAGRPRFLRETIAPVPLPRVHVDAAGGHTIDRESPLSSLSGSVVGRDLYLLSAERQGERILDVYEVETGSYRYSLRPPESDSRYMILTADRLFSASRRGVTLWRRLG